MQGNPASSPSRFGRYEVKKILGQGQMGIVYLAKDPWIGRCLAVKVLRHRPDFCADDVREGEERFEREIRVCGKFAHPNIVTVHDVGLEDPVFVAMEHIEGGSLEKLLAEEDVLSPDRAVQLTECIASALDYAHERGIVHRDIKPANILLTPEGVPKVADFGVARLVGATMTREGATYGSPAFMSPEQAAGQRVDSGSDQFSLAVVAYRMITGELPFSGDSVTAVIFRILKHDPVPPELLNPLIPEQVGHVMQRAMSKNPAERYPTCGDFAKAFRIAIGRSAVVPHPSAAQVPLPDRTGEMSATAGPMGSAPVYATAGEMGQTDETVVLRSTRWKQMPWSRVAAYALLLSVPFVLAGYGWLLDWVERRNVDAARPTLAEPAPNLSPAQLAVAAAVRDAIRQESKAADPETTASAAAPPRRRVDDLMSASATPLSTKLADRARSAADVLDALVRIREEKLPESLLAESRCVAVIPGVVKVGFIFAGRHGKGLVSCRVGDGWSRPSFLSITGGSIGLQIGAQSTDFVLLFSNELAAQRLTGGKFTLGGDASVAAGPVGRTAEAATDVTLSAEIYSYSRSRGLFAGVSLEGATLRADSDANEEVYGAGMEPRELLYSRARGLPRELADFIRTLRRTDE